MAIHKLINQDKLKPCCEKTLEDQLPHKSCVVCGLLFVWENITKTNINPTWWGGDDEERHQRIKDKYGDYHPGACPNCGRHRLMDGKDGKRRCEKCHWCVEDNDYDNEMWV